MTLSELTSVFGWMTIINLGILVFVTLMLRVARGWAMSMHRRFLPLSDDDLNRAYFAYLANFKIAWLMLNAVPWLALTLMG